MNIHTYSRRKITLKNRICRPRRNYAGSYVYINNRSRIHLTNSENRPLKLLQRKISKAGFLTFFAFKVLIELKKKLVRLDTWGEN